MLKKSMHALFALTLAVGTAAVSAQPAGAGHWHHRHHHHHRGNGGSFAAGVATGVIGLGLLGAIASRGPHCYDGPRRCEWRGRHCFENHYGEWVCRGGHYSCWRPTICDD
jgi:hypothetical protein